ncbi:hypothetical protein J6590_096563 [Homalodisca vitripennis]|nr:hypothetical protein J6590_096563 [Homalodisca vitripennis]
MTPDFRCQVCEDSDSRRCTKRKRLKPVRERHSRTFPHHYTTADHEDERYRCRRVDASCYTLPGRDFPKVRILTPFVFLADVAFPLEFQIEMVVSILRGKTEDFQAENE